jgi:uncharacterized protein (TIGR04255 family)
MPIYKNAPIKEAIFDIRIKEKNLLDIDVLRNIPHELKEKYPTTKTRNRFHGQFTIGQGTESFAKTLPEGFIFSNKENSRLFQFRINGYAYNILKPYSNWEDFSKEAFTIWQLYKSLIGDFQIELIALRFINRIELPMPITSFDEYLTYVPPIPDSLPKILSRFFMQVEIPIEQSGTNVILTETIEQIEDFNDNSQKLPFLLDINCLKQIPDGSITESKLVEAFSELRNIKNDIFENCITDKARELFK